MESSSLPSLERSKRLHNFTLPHLKWGQQRFLRCVNLPSPSPSSSPPQKPTRSTKRPNEDEPTRKWNLRTRRADPEEEIGSLKFSVSLCREEVEEDIWSLSGKKPSRRPKKRPKLVQKKVNTVFPGLWLSEEVTIEEYDVPEDVEEMVLSLAELSEEVTIEEYNVAEDVEA